MTDNGSDTAHAVPGSPEPVQIVEPAQVVELEPGAEALVIAPAEARPDVLARREPDEAEVRRILEERAHALARSTDDDAGGETTSLLVLALGDERYGVDIQYVQEIEPLSRLTPMPGVPAFWAGVVNLRGNMHPVLDLRRYLSLDGQPVDKPRVALVASDGVSVGLMVDDVPEVRRVPFAEIGPPVTETGGSRPEVVKGVTSDMLSVLDLRALLSEPSLVIEDEVAA